MVWSEKLQLLAPRQRNAPEMQPVGGPDPVTCDIDVFKQAGDG